MKKIAVLFIMLVIMAGLTACSNTPDLSDGNELTIKMELDQGYDDTEPFVNEKLFSVSDDMETFIAEGTLRLDGKSVILEVKNNKTKEVLWSSTWDGEVQSDTFSISLNNVKKDDEYVVCLTGRKINYAALEITFDGDFVQERERPLQ
ncbi:DUF4624 family lipoprotein [Emergencia sp.]|uniref:DUF4624 family lipoprotein n=1 Tax=Emergencia sp. TaxID=1926557 RepID=UPI003AF05A76